MSLCVSMLYNCLYPHVIECLQSSLRLLAIQRMWVGNSTFVCVSIFVLLNSHCRSELARTVRLSVGVGVKLYMPHGV